MYTMRSPAKWLAIVSIFVTQVAAAAPFDGSRAMICASLSKHLCSVDETCEVQSWEDSDVPRFLKVSVEGKKVTGVRPSGGTVDATIENIRRATDTLYLQGAQEAFAWSMAIDEKDGAMTLTAADKGNGMVIFGACTIP
jgi:hypothetical protein